MEGELTLFFFVVTSQGTGLVLEGRHNADMGWISELRRNGNALVNTKCLFFIFLALIL
jgi:chitinase domain-containing protein 1